MRSISETPARCQATLFDGSKPCRRDAPPSAIYCPTHQFLLEPLAAAAGPLSLDAELRLIRLELHKLVAAGAPTGQLLNALRTLAVIARLQARLERLRT
jgi:hypothetical protein